MKHLRILMVLTAMLFGVVAITAQEDDTDLPQSITSQDDNFGVTLTVNYPADWMALEDFGTVLLTNTEAVMTALESGEGVNTVDEGQVAVSVSGVGLDIIEILQLDPEASLTDILNALFVDSVAEADFSEVEELDLNGKNAVAIAASSTINDDPGRLYVIVTEEADGYVVFSALTAQGDASFDETVQQIAGAVEATFGQTAEMTPEAEMSDMEMTEEADVDTMAEVEATVLDLDIPLLESLTTDEDPDLGAFSISYPEGWTVNASPGSVIMANSEDLLATLQAGGDDIVYEEGDAATNIGVLPLEFLPFLGLDADATLEEVALSIIDQSLGANPDVESDFGDPQRFEVNGVEQVVVTGDIIQENTEARATFITSEINGAIVILTGLTSLGDESFLETFQSIAASIEFAPPAGTEDE